jgi:hypothetical protein
LNIRWVRAGGGDFLAYLDSVRLELRVDELTGGVDLQQGFGDSEELRRTLNVLARQNRPVPA